MQQILQQDAIPREFDGAGENGLWCGKELEADGA
jgi:hypothetical protein